MYHARACYSYLYYTAAQVISIHWVFFFHFQKQRGQRKLSKHLNLTADDGELDMRQAIHLDFLYDNLMFAAEKGFPWNHVCLVVKFAENVLTNSLGTFACYVLYFIFEM